MEKILSNPSAFVNGLLPTAQAQNNSVAPANDVESNNVWFNNLLLDRLVSGLSLSPGQISDLRILAAKCPYNDGQAVYHARAILKQIEDVEYQNDCESAGFQSQRSYTSNSEIQNDELSFKLFPNPNNGTMNFSYALKEGENGTFSIYDLTGKLLSEYPLQTGNDQLLFINEDNLSNGIYFCKVIIDGKLKMSDKIVIIK